MHVLAFGWEDWSAWDPQDERLNRARQKYPELHRINALSKLQELHHVPAVGLILRISIDKDDALGADGLYTDGMGNYEDALRFYIECGRAAPNMVRRETSWWRAIYGISQEMLRQTGGRDRARVFWEPYLDSDVPTLWYCAQKAFVRPVPGGFEWLNKAQADWNYEHEPDPAVRARLARRREIARQMAEINARENPETGRLSMEDVAALQALRAELKRLDEEDARGQPPE
jgi:hypothetical protein